MSAAQDADVLLVGAGIMAAVVAAQVRAAHPDARLLMVDAGPPLGSAFGHHLHDTPDRDAREGFAARAFSGNQAMYVGASRTAGGAADLAALPAGLRTLGDLGHEASEMPGASIAWNLGGMSVHWAAAAPTPYGDEVPEAIPADEWPGDLAEAQRLLRVNPGPYPPDRVGDRVLEVLDEYVGPVSAEGRHPQAMPVSINADAEGRLARTGPAAVFPPIERGGDAAFVLRHSTLVTRVLIEDGRATGAVLRSIADGTEEVVRAPIVVVCADTFRTPQLLFASGVGGPALGSRLNEHAFLAGRVLVDLERLGADGPPAPLEGEWATSASWLPHSGDAQPFQGQIMQAPVPGEDGGPAGYAVTLALYVPTEVRAENRIEFSAEETDATGLPRMSVRFGYSAADLALIDRGRAVQAEAGARLGDFDSERDSLLLDAGASLHYTGTARMGAVDDGTSVCDADGRVWGVEGLLVAGNAVVPTALVANSTLAGAVTAVRAGRAVAAALAGTP
ncbi:GMC oxidoreductase [Rathayibacter sp. VKM Ac-2760]|uniref:GMC oxidoreductase n=1 Tax=Rathayibacter sp. VKM Ac-2760 TaxID=2609253 RepID=UPI001318D80F|nr:GMC oxidoreductase [Rathayibacter sp. VKM Ac-2760]QHC60167.1 choline dehydrogenase [Rathayibacter sp. VKM Ac-2760]